MFWSRKKTTRWRSRASWISWNVWLPSGRERSTPLISAPITGLSGSTLIVSYSMATCSSGFRLDPPANGASPFVNKIVDNIAWNFLPCKATVRMGSGAMSDKVVRLREKPKARPERRGGAATQSAVDRRRTGHAAPAHRPPGDPARLQAARARSCRRVRRAAHAHPRGVRCAGKPRPDRAHSQSRRRGHAAGARRMSSSCTTCARCWRGSAPALRPRTCRRSRGRTWSITSAGRWPSTCARRTSTPTSPATSACASASSRPRATWSSPRCSTASTRRPTSSSAASSSCRGGPRSACASTRPMLAAMRRGDAAEAERLKRLNLRSAKETLMRFRSYVL